MKSRLRRAVAVLLADMATTPGVSMPGSVIAEVGGLRLGKSGEVVAWPAAKPDALSVWFQIIAIYPESIRIRIYTTGNPTELLPYIVAGRAVNTDTDAPVETVTPTGPVMDYDFTGLVLGENYYLLVQASDE